MQTKKTQTVDPVGLIRNLDRLGRIFIPMEYRKFLDWEEGDPLEILMFEDKTLLIKRAE